MINLLGGLSIGAILGIVIPIVVIAVCAILYFFYFKEKINSSIKARKEKSLATKTAKEAERQKETNLVSDVFAKRDKIEEVKSKQAEEHDDKSVDLELMFQQQRNKMISERNIQQQNAALEKVDKKPKGES